MILGVLFIILSFAAGTYFFYNGVKRISKTGQLVPENPIVPKKDYELIWKFTTFYAVPILQFYSVINPNFSLYEEAQKAIQEAE